MERLSKKAVEVTKGLHITYPGWGNTQTVVPQKPNSASSGKTYNVQGDFITFVTEDGKTFAIPEIGGIEVYLIINGYRKDLNLYVFFSAGEAYPTAQKAKWDALLAEVRARAKLKWQNRMLRSQK